MTDKELLAEAWCGIKAFVKATGCTVADYPKVGWLLAEIEKALPGGSPEPEPTSEESK